MTLPTIRDLERAICCPSSTCCRPERCDAHRPGSVLVDVRRAAEAVQKLVKEPTDA